MIFQTRTRRNAIVALVLICLLVCGGLAWATWTGLQLEAIEAASVRERAQDAQKRSNENKVALTLTFLDGIVDSAMAMERTRPFEHYRAFYRPTKAINVHDRLPATDVVVPSPLLSFSGPEWIVLHFQYSMTSDWTSPELDRDFEAALLSGSVPPADPRKLAVARDWLMALRDCDPFHIQRQLEEQLENARRFQIELERTSGAQSARGQELASPSVAADDEDDTDRSADAFARRGLRLVDLQRKYLPREECEPVLVAIDNLQIHEEYLAEASGGGDCSYVSLTEMLPMWLEMTRERNRQLALVRSVSVERVSYCTLQGVLINWELLRKTLENEAEQIIPGARIEPVEIGSTHDYMMRTIPAKLVAPMPALMVEPPSTGMKWGLILTWGATVLALIAICWGTMKYLGMVERRMEFVAAVTHELRTPLTSFQIYTDLLADLNDDPVRRSQYIETLRKESKRLARLVENVLGYSKIGGARPRLNMTTLSPQEILDAIHLQTKDQCAAAGKQLVLENRCEEGAQVSTDPEFVIQILANLVENACKYSSNAADARVWLTARPSEEHGIEFEVEDLGHGVAAGDRRAIFRPFRRSSSAENGRATGMGLGLALSRYWATCLGGQLLLRRGERNGEHYARFALCLPPSA